MTTFILANRAEHNSGFPFGTGQVYNGVGGRSYPPYQNTAHQSRASEASGLEKVTVQSPRWLSSLRIETKGGTERLLAKSGAIVWLQLMGTSEQEYCIVTFPQATNNPQPHHPHGAQTEQQKSIQTIATAAILVIAAYIAAQMLADVASLKIGLVGGWSVDMGTFIYPITFTLRDLVHKLLGKRSAQLLIVTAAVINLIMAGYLMWAASVPSDPSWGLGEAFSAILAPVWRIVLASIAAEVVSELIDTEVYHWFVTKVTRRFQWLRVLLSNSVSVPVDNVIFAVGAFGWVLSWGVVWQIFLFNLVIKYGVTLVSLPFIYLSPDPDWEE